jgi:glutathionylspermidine synthase
MATKGSGRPRKSSAKKSTKEPIPINTAVTPQSETATAPSSVQREAASDGQHIPGMNREWNNIQEEIRQRAYELYEERGRQEGYEHQDWVRAEEEILAKYQKEKSA